MSTVQENQQLEKQQTSEVLSAKQKHVNTLLFTGLPMGKPSRGLRLVSLFYFFYFFYFFLFLFFFSVSVKVLTVTPLVSGVFVHRAFCAYFLRIERVVELRIFLWWTQSHIVKDGLDWICKTRTGFVKHGFVKRAECIVKLNISTRNFVFEHEGMPKMPGIITRCKRVLLVFLDFS